MSLEIVKKLKPCEFKWKDNKVVEKEQDYKVHFGFIAQEVEKILPKSKYGIINDKEGYIAIRYLEFIPLLVKAIQELEEKIKMLEDKNGNII